MQNPAEKTEVAAFLYINELNAEDVRVGKGARRENKY